MFITDVDADHARQALTELVVAEGLAAPSLRSLARAAGVSPTTLLNWFGSSSALQGRVLDVLTARLDGRLRHGFFPDDVSADGVSADDVSRDDQVPSDLRLRLAFAELARADDEVADVFSRTLHVERSAIRRMLVASGLAPRVSAAEGSAAEGWAAEGWAAERSAALEADLIPPPETVELLHATLLGLWSRMCDRHVPMPAARARELWAVACQSWTL